jgi:hypothetical protein
MMQTRYKGSDFKEWTRHLKDDEAKQKFYDAVTNHLYADIVVKRLIEILEERKQKKIQEFSKHVDYNQPSWAYAQAALNGSLRELEDLLALFDLTKGK